MSGNRQYSVISDNKYTYFDYYQADPETSDIAIGGDLPTEKVYRFKPIRCRSTVLIIYSHSEVGKSDLT
jgi:hypothetical protein